VPWSPKPGQRGAFPFWAAFLSGVIPWLMLVQATKPFRIKFPDCCRTAGELARFLVAHAPQPADTKSRIWTREEVAETVRRMTIEQFGLKPEDYRADARFVEDLGAG
jgi:hypothetical protein